jgi:lipopolysaccharide export LptBFGC system permease protein LptF
MTARQRRARTQAITGAVIIAAVAVVVVAVAVMGAVASIPAIHACAVVAFLAIGVAVVAGAYSTTIR